MRIGDLELSEGEDRRSFQNLFLLNLLNELEKRESGYREEVRRKQLEVVRRK